MLVCDFDLEESSTRKQFVCEDLHGSGPDREPRQPAFLMGLEVDFSAGDSGIVSGIPGGGLASSRFFSLPNKTVIIQ